MNAPQARFPALAHRDFRILWLGMLLASTTFAFQYYAQMWLIYSLTGSPLVLGVLGAVRGVAMLTFGLWGGALADRLDRRWLLLATEALALLVAALLGLLAMRGAVDLWLAFGLIFAGAAVSSVDAPIRQALIPELVPHQHIPNAVALTSAAQMGSFALTPVLAGFVIDALGPGGAYLASTLGNVAVLVALLSLDYRGRSTEARRESMLETLRGGLAYARHHPQLPWILAVLFTTSAFGMAIYSGLIVKWAREVLGLEPGAYGLLAAAWGVGTLVVSYGLSYLGEVPQRGRIFLWGSLLFGLSFALFGFARGLLLAGFAYLINGAAWAGASIASVAIVQTQVPNELRGRVMSLVSLNQAVAQLNGIALGAAAFFVGMEVLVPAATLLCSALVGLLMLSVPALRRLGRDAA
ncbi:MAG: MFS transporter [Myxococcota bacterium]